MANALQKTKIVHLYRDSLKTLLSWAVSREVFYDKASGLAGGVQRRVHVCAWLPQAAFCYCDTHPSCTDATQAAELRKVFEANASLVGGVPQARWVGSDGAERAPHGPGSHSYRPFHHTRTTTIPLRGPLPRERRP